MIYPTEEQVKTAGIHAVLRWNRFLPPPTSATEKKVLLAVLARHRELKEEKPGDFVAASREIGF